MNIFALSQDPNEAAVFHCDKHCVKMIVETAQLLSTAHRILDGKSFDTKQNGRKKTVWLIGDARDDILYQSTHRNHPSAVWVRSTKENYIWGFELLKSLCKEYTYRYSKTHKTELSGVVDALSHTPINIDSKSLEPFALAMPDEFKQDDRVESYRKYYRVGKSHLHSWKKREVPHWIK